MSAENTSLVEYVDLREVEVDKVSLFKYRGKVYYKQHYPQLLEVLKENFEWDAKAVFSTHTVTHGITDRGRTLEFLYCNAVVFLQSGKVIFLTSSERCYITSCETR